jgi:hypothetical protein
LRQIIEEKEEFIANLQANNNSDGDYTRKNYQSQMPKDDSAEVEKLQKQLRLNEHENEKLREQALQADREIDRLKENIILREREIHNVKKSIANKDSFPKEKLKQSDLALSIETNPNLVNEMAKMSGSSGFKYGQKGPYDESLEKLRKEFSLQQKELGLETLSESSFDRKFKSPENKAMALIMGESIVNPTGDIKADYSALLEENKQLKMIVKEMRKEMELVVHKLNENQAKNFESPGGDKSYGYLDSNNLQLLEKQNEIDRLKEEVSRLRSQTYLVEKSSENKTVTQLEKKLEEKREHIVKLKEVRDKLLEVCNDMKIQINSMKKNQEFSLGENINITNIVTKQGLNK